RKAAAHLVSTTGVKFSSGGCGRATATSTTCTLRTESDRRVVVRLVSMGGEQYFETVSGLLDGDALGTRLANDLSRELHASVQVECTKVVAANVGDTTRCRVSGAGVASRMITVRILDDRTGDYTIVARRASAVAVTTTPRSGR